MQSSNDPQRGSSQVPGVSNSMGRSSSYLSAGLRIKGEISGNEDLKLDSNVDGLVSIGGFRLTLGPTAHLNGDIVAREAIIAGEVHGDISAFDRIEVTKTASIIGDLSTTKILIEEGAYFKGGIEIGKQNSQIGTDLDNLLKGSKKEK
ncbi:MAG TPA: polymer-forming cytoskeletal protein [Candidatus Saccharimonadales bacterium]|jgi:cytoskeletal protein CcmA (bactofilin family)|nr:polymer-forming cytoskeletal protein [Candidatus Saccharimonadales bacterium]